MQVIRDLAPAVEEYQREGVVTKVSPPDSCLNCGARGDTLLWDPVADDVRMEIDIGEFLGDEVKQAGFLEAVDLVVEFETFEDVRTAGENAQMKEEKFGSLITFSLRKLLSGSTNRVCRRRM